MSDTIDIYLGSLEVSKEDIRQSIINKGVTPEGGLTSYAKAIDDIYVPSTGNASVEYSSNGDYTINPQEYGYDALSGINVNVKVKSSGGSGKPMIPNGFYFGEGSDIGLVDFSQYDWSMVYDTTQFFKGCKNTVGWDNFEQHYNGKVLGGSYMFQNCTNLTTIPQLDTSNVMNMSYMFFNCTNLTTIPQLDTSNVMNMSYMFQSCTNLTSVPQFDISKVTNMDSMFRDCKNLTTIPQLDTSNVTNMQNMFNGCSNLTTIPQLDTSNVMNMSYMFQSCYKLTTIPQLDTSNVTNMGGMFSYCQRLTSAPQLDISKVTIMYYMFNNCTNLKEVRFKGQPTSSVNVSGVFGNVPTGGTLYYDSRYDYSKIINAKPSGWTAVPYDVEEYESQL